MSTALPDVASTPPDPAGQAALWLDAYRALLAGQDRIGLLRTLCMRLAGETGFRMITLTRKLGSGVVAMQAWSREDALWLDLQRLPERWDGTVVGDGPAARALVGGRPVWMGVEEEAFTPWRRAAEAEGIRAAAAVPFLVAGESWLLQLYAVDREAFSKPGVELQLRRMGEDFAALLEDDRRQREQRLLAAALTQAHSAAFITDLEGRIGWCNPAFSRLSGHPPEAVLGKNPKLLQSGRQGLRYYRNLWSTLRSAQAWSGETVERHADGQIYTVWQTITPFGTGERISHYFSLHQDISGQKDEQRRRELEAGNDPVTGLATRARLDARLQEAFAVGEPLGLALIKLASLPKAIATLGADFGDTLLAEVGERFRALLPEPCLVCRGEDGEFLLLLVGIEPERRAGLLDDLQDALRAPYPLVGEQLGQDYRQVLVAREDRDADADALWRRLDRGLADQPLGRARRQRAVI